MQNISTFSVRPSTKKVGKKCVDCTPFGMAMVGRDKAANPYRYGYNGMEIDPEMKGKGNEYTTEFRQYDPRVGRWMSLDPLMMQFPWMSPYCAFDNNPVLLNDIYGLSTEDEGKPKPTKLIGVTYENHSGETVGVIDDVVIMGKKIGNTKPMEKMQDEWQKPSLAPTAKQLRDQEIQDDPMKRTERDYQAKGGAMNNMELSMTYIRNQSDCMDPIGKLFNIGIGGAAAAFILPVLIPLSPTVMSGLTTNSYLTTSLANGAINGATNIGSQLSVNGNDWSKVDLIGAGAAVGSGFLPGSSLKSVVRNSMITGAVDACFDLNIKGEYSHIGNKNPLSTAVDFTFGTLGNLGGGSLTKAPIVFRALGTGLATLPTTAISNQINIFIQKDR